MWIEYLLTYCCVCWAFNAVRAWCHRDLMARLVVAVVEEDGLFAPPFLYHFTFWGSTIFGVLASPYFWPGEILCGHPWSLPKVEEYLEEKRAEDSNTCDENCTC